MPRSTTAREWEGEDLARGVVEKKFADQYAAWSADPFNVAPARWRNWFARSLSAKTRCRALMQIVAENAGKRLPFFIAAHKATNRLLLCSLIGIDPREYRNRIEQDLACLNIIEFKDEGRAQALVINDRAHTTWTLNLNPGKIDASQDSLGPVAPSETYGRRRG